MAHVEEPPDLRVREAELVKGLPGIMAGSDYLTGPNPPAHLFERYVPR